MPNVRQCGDFFGNLPFWCLSGDTHETKPTNSVPSYRRHNQSGQAIVTLSGGDYLLGPWGTNVSELQDDRPIAEWLGRNRQPIHTSAGLTVADIAVRNWARAKKRYIWHGRPTPQQLHIKTAITHTLRLNENHPAAEFAPVH